MEPNVFMEWISQDPLFRICILTEVIVWIVATSIASFCVCAFRRKCLREYYKVRALHRRKQRDESDGDARAAEAATAADAATAGVAVPIDGIDTTSRAQLCFKYRHIWTLAVGIVVGFALMVISLAIAVPIVAPHWLYHPEDCEEAGRYCETLPDAENLFVKTESGANISIRHFPAEEAGRYFAKNFR